MWVRCTAATFFSPEASPMHSVDGVTCERNVCLHKGWFDDIVPPFLQTLPKTPSGEPLPYVSIADKISCNAVLMRDVVAVVVI